MKRGMALGRVALYAVLLSSGAALAGCSNFESPFMARLDSDVTATPSGTNQVIPKTEINLIDLDTLVKSHIGNGSDPLCSRAKKSGEVLSLNELMSAFTQCGSSGSDPFSDTTSLEFHRNQVQSTVMTAARRRCEVYKLYMANMETETNFWLGSASTITGVLGGLFTATSTARSLAAASGISSGVQAEFNQSFFKNTAMPVIFAGIDMKRLEIQTDIDSKRKKRIGEYHLEDALGDAMRYNGACSAVEGLQHVKDTLAKPVGLATAQQVLREVGNVAAEIEAAGEKDPTKKAALYEKLKASAVAQKEYLITTGQAAAEAAPSAAEGDPNAMNQTQLGAAIDERKSALKEKDDRIAAAEGNKKVAEAQQKAAEEGTKNLGTQPAADKTEELAAWKKKEKELADAKAEAVKTAASLAELIAQLAKDKAKLTQEKAFLEDVQKKLTELTASVTQKIANAKPASAADLASLFTVLGKTLPEKVDVATLKEYLSKSVVTSLGRTKLEKLDTALGLLPAPQANAGGESAGTTGGAARAGVSVQSLPAQR